MTRSPLAPVALVPVGALVLALAACGSDDAGSKAGGIDSAAAAAKAIGCSTSSDHDTDEMFVTDAATCEVDGQEVTVYYFSTNEARDSYVDAAGAFGGQYLVGDQFAVDADPEVLTSLEGKVDGTTVKP